MNKDQPWEQTILAVIWRSVSIDIGIQACDLCSQVGLYSEVTINTGLTVIVNKIFIEN